MSRYREVVSDARVDLSPGRTVAIVPAFRRADTVGATVAALREHVDRVVVVDDGSGDDTAVEARGAGADVVELAVNAGKGAAVAAGIAAAPAAQVYLLIDSDVGASARPESLKALLGPVVAGECDMTVGVLPAAGGKGGFGLIKRLSRGAIRRACGLDVVAPLSGQRAVRGELLRSLILAERFGLEVGLTIDAVRAGARVAEVPIEMDHRHTGRSVAGFSHRARQGRDILRALVPRVSTAGQRMGVIGVAAALAALVMLWSGANWEASSRPLPAANQRVVVLGAPGLSLANFDDPELPALQALVRQGAFGAASVRTVSGGPNPTEAYASMGASARVRASRDLANQVVAVSEPLNANANANANNGVVVDGATVLEQRTGVAPAITPESVLVLSLPAAENANARNHVPNTPGALGDALHDAGLRTAIVGVADRRSATTGFVSRSRPGAFALVDRSGTVDMGVVESERLLIDDPLAPGGWRSDPSLTVAAVVEMLDAGAAVVVADPGDFDRLAATTGSMTPDAVSAARRAALERLDATVALLREELADDTALIVMGVTPRPGAWRLTPTALVSSGVGPATLHSPATRRSGLVTITDVAPTVLSLVGAEIPKEMIGSPWRFEDREADIGSLRILDRDAAFRERIYFPIVLAYIIGQAALYLLLMAVIGRLGGIGRAEAVARWTVLAVAAFPVATFLLRLVPDLPRGGSAGAVAVLVGMCGLIATIALRCKRGPVAPLGFVCGLTVAVTVVDIATGGRLQVASLLGYSPHTAGRFFGIGNTAFAVLTASALIWACAHVAQAPRKREAVFTAACVLGIVALVDGAPSLGSDVGGILTMVPIFALTIWALAGRRISWRSVVVAIGAMAVLLAIATAVDLLRPAADRTHLGRFVSDIANGDDSTFVTTLQRKLATNVRVFTRSIWTWTVPIIAIFGLFLIVWDRRTRALLPARSPYRIATVSVLAAGLLGFAVNDSGVVVTALVLVYVAPFLTLLALDEKPAPSTTITSG